MSERTRLVLLILFATAAGQLSVIPNLVAVVTTGSFIDTDDAMRLVQIRNLMGGQPWFDMTEWRLDPPLGVFSHWSHIIDIPIIALIKLFDLALSPDMAERAARIAYPLGITALLYLAVVRLCDQTVGRKHVGVALLAAALTVPFKLQFQPGRIDHHSAQIILLTAFVAAMIASLERPRLAAAGALFLAASVGVSLENLPFAPLAALPAVMWILHGRSKDAERLMWFAGALALFMPLAFLGTVGPARWTVVVNDAYSIAHLCAALVGALCCLMLALATPRAPRRSARLALAGALGLAAAATLVLAFPGLLRGPFADVDPIVRKFWLANVSEAQPISRLLRTDPLTAISSMVPLIVGMAGAVVAAVQSRNEERTRWLALCAPLAVGLVCAFWMMRVTYSDSPLAVPGAVYLALAFQHWAEKRTQVAGKFTALCCFILFTSLPGASAIAGVLIGAETTIATGANATAAASTSPHGIDATCFSPSAMRELAGLPKGVVFNELDLGPFILAFTPHSVLAGPYHRDNHGDRLVIEAMHASPADAMTMIRASGADYVAACPGAPDETSDWPGSFEAEIGRGGAIAGLARISAEGAPLTLFRVVR